jgi:hypothetical protein
MSLLPPFASRPHIKLYILSHGSLSYIFSVILQLLPYVPASALFSAKELFFLTLQKHMAFLWAQVSSLLSNKKLIHKENILSM